MECGHGESTGSIPVHMPDQATPIVRMFVHVTLKLVVMSFIFKEGGKPSSYFFPPPPSCHSPSPTPFASLLPPAPPPFFPPSFPSSPPPLSLFYLPLSSPSFSSSLSHVPRPAKSHALGMSLVHSSVLLCRTWISHSSKTFLPAIIHSMYPVHHQRPLCVGQSSRISALGLAL